MAISKTDFINFTRCKRFVALENIRKDKLTSKLTKEEYLKEKTEEKISEIIDNIFEFYKDKAELGEKLSFMIERIGLEIFKENVIK